MTLLIHFNASLDHMKRQPFSLDIPTDNIGIYGEKFVTGKNCLRVFPIVSAQNYKKFSIILECPMPDKPLRHNMAKVEFLGCWEKIKSMLAEGFSKRIVYETLLAENLQLQK